MARPPSGHNRTNQPKHMDTQGSEKSGDQSNPSPAIDTVVQSHSVILSQLSSQLTSAFASVRGEINELRQSSRNTSSVLDNLSKQLSSLNENVSKHFLNDPVDVPQPNEDHVSFENDSFRSPQCEPNLPTPKPFEGNLSLCRGFLTQCELIFRHQQSRYSSSEARVAFLISLLSGRALQWAVASLEKDPVLSSRYEQFVKEFCLVFDHPVDGSDSASEGRNTLCDFCATFSVAALSCCSYCASESHE